MYFLKTAILSMLSYMRCASFYLRSHLRVDIEAVIVSKETATKSVVHFFRLRLCQETPRTKMKVFTQAWEYCFCHESETKAKLSFCFKSKDKKSLIKFLSTNLTTNSKK